MSKLDRYSGDSNTRHLSDTCKYSDSNVEYIKSYYHYVGAEKVTEIAELKSTNQDISSGTTSTESNSQKVDMKASLCQIAHAAKFKSGIVSREKLTSAQVCEAAKIKDPDGKNDKTRTSIWPLFMLQSIFNNKLFRSECTTTISSLFTNSAAWVIFTLHHSTSWSLSSYPKAEFTMLFIRLYVQKYSVIWFLFIWLSGFVLMDLILGIQTVQMCSVSKWCGNQM